jgi:hypothetical protein
MKKLFQTRKSRWRLAVRTLPIIFIVFVAKYLAHYYDVEFLTLNALFTAIISANIFLIGFLITGTLSDFKESERLPSELAASIQVMIDEAYIIYLNKKSPEALNLLNSIKNLNEKLIDWFYKRTKTDEIYSLLLDLNKHFLLIESQTQANFIVRIKNEQNNLRRNISRIHTIRETSFLGTGYAIAEIITTILIIGLIFVNLNPFHEKMFFVSFVSFMMVYMIFFIKDLDNPFSYYESDSLVEEVSLKPITDCQQRIDKLISSLD